MATIPFTSHLDLQKNQLQNSVVHNLGADPGSPVPGQIWYDTVLEKYRIRLASSTDSLATVTDVSAGGVSASAWDAQSVVVAITDDTPVAVVIANGTFVGRPTGGNVGALSAADAKTILGIPAGSVANQAYVDAAITALVDTAPGALDTLNEIAASLGDDADFAGTMTTNLAAKADKYAQTFGDGSATVFNITHSLATLDVVVAVVPVAGGPAVLVDWEATSTNVVQLDFNTAPTASQYRVTVIG